MSQRQLHANQHKQNKHMKINQQENQINIQPTLINQILEQLTN
jgi:hypothetical protein